MTGVNELRNVAVVSAASEQFLVSVLGGRTQLDVALPADMPVTAFLPELVRLIGSRDTRRDEEMTDRDERRTFWVLGRVDGGAELAPDETLRAAGITNGELLRVSTRRALSPPTLYDDVVDAAARLNRAAYASWDATAAGVMAFAGLWLCTAVWVFFLLSDALSAHRGVVIGGTAVTVVTMVVAAAMVHRALGRTDVANAVGWPAVTLSAALGWVLAAAHGAAGLAVACAVLLVLTAVYYRVVGTGHWAYIAAAVVFAAGGAALLLHVSGTRVDVLAAAAAIAAVLGALVVPALTTMLGRLPTPTAEPEAAREDSLFADPLAEAADEITPSVAMPGAEEVWARVQSAALTRAGLLAGLATVVAVGGAVLLQARTGLPALTFALACAAVLALRSRRVRTLPERAALAVPAVVLVVVACWQAQAGGEPTRLAGVGVLVVIAVVAVLAGLLVTGRRAHGWVPVAAAYLDYAAAAAVLPLALWALGAYDRLGLR